MEFLNTALTFPTVIFSVLLIIVCLFWLTNIIGLADIDIFEGDIEVEAEANASSGLFNNMGLGDVPITVSASIIIMTSWLISFYSQSWILSFMNNNPLYYLIGGVVILACFVISLPISAILVKPLKRFFTSKETASKNDLIGLECIIATGKVTETFGQARVNIQGTEQLIEVRIQDLQHKFELGNTAVLIDHLIENNSYTIAPKPW